MLFILVSAICVSIDAACCNVVNGIEVKKINKYFYITSSIFALFQGVMLFLGYQFTFLFGDNILKISTILAFLLLLYLSIVMIISSFKNEDTVDLNIKNILTQGLATSIDASALGITFRVLNVNIFQGIFFVVLFTFLLSLLAFIIGIKVGNKFNKHMKLIGGIVLLAIAIKILLF